MSEPEVRNIANFMLDRTDCLRFYISLHSYTQFWFTRWSFADVLPPDHDELVSFVSYTHLRSLKVAKKFAIKGRLSRGIIIKSMALHGKLVMNIDQKDKMKKLLLQTLGDLKLQEVADLN